MSKSATVPRWQFLALNVKDIKKSTFGTKLRVTRNNESTPPLDQTELVPWVMPLDQFQMTRNQIGAKLLKRCRNGFYLDDPKMNESKFCIEYHRLHDPSLKRYYNSVAVKNRLKKLELINDGNDVICTNKEMMEYLRYLDGIRSRNIATLMKEKVCLLLYRNIR